MIRTVFDLTCEGIDLVFKNNCRLDSFSWYNSPDEVKNGYSDWINAVAILSGLWRPAHFIIYLAPVIYGASTGDEFSFNLDTHPGEEIDELAGRIEEAIQTEIIKQESASGDDEQWGLTRIQSTAEGWCRIALPENSEKTSRWHIVYPDNLFPARYRSQNAPPLAGIPTIWISLDDGSASSHISLFVNALNDADLKLTLGATFFDPKADNRPAEHIVRGIPLKDWQAVNQKLVDDCEDKIVELGWEVKKKYI